MAWLQPYRQFPECVLVAAFFKVLPQCKSHNYTMYIHVYLIVSSYAILHCMSSCTFAVVIMLIHYHLCVSTNQLPCMVCQCNHSCFLVGIKKQPNFTEFQASMPNPNQASSPLLPTVSHRTQDGRSSNSPDANLMIPSAKVRGRILGLAATPIELVN